MPIRPILPRSTRRRARPALSGAVPAILLAVAGIGLSCSGRSKPPDVVLITIDTVRADRVGAWGDSRGLTPEIDRLARHGTAFSRTTAQVPLTTPSHASILTGTYPTYHGVRKNGGFRLDPAFDTLPEIFRDAGYQTAGFVSSFALNAIYGFDQGFETWDDVEAGRETMHMDAPKDGTPTQSTYPERPGGETVTRALRWLELAPKGRPVFLWVHLYDPHFPYTPVQEYAARFRDDPYRGEIAATDAEIGRLLGGLRAGRSTVIALLSDHGEAFGEKGEWQHGFFLYETTLHVPMLFVAPGRVPPGSIRADLAQSVDLFPTLLGLAGLSWSGPHQGRDLFAAAPSGDPLAYGETLYGKLSYGWSDLRMVRRDDMKYIMSPSPELYDLAQDPGEGTNILLSQPGEGAGLAREIGPILAVKPDLPESAGVVAVSHEEAEALASLGYIGSARVVAGRAGLDDNPGRGVDPRLALPWSNALGHLDSLAMRGAADSALALADQIAAAREAGIPIRLSAGGRLYNWRRYDRALRIFKMLADEAPQDADVFVNLGTCYLSTGQVEPARAALWKAIALNPGNALARLNLARSFANFGEPDSALLHVRDAVRLDPTDPNSRVLLTKILVEKGHVEEAYAAVREALRLAPANAEALELRFKLETTYPELKENPRAAHSG